jgi:hypothetical protein
MEHLWKIRYSEKKKPHHGDTLSNTDLTYTSLAPNLGLHAEKSELSARVMSLRTVITINKKHNDNYRICQSTLQNLCSSDYRKLFSQVQVNIRKIKQYFHTAEKKLHFVHYSNVSFWQVLGLWCNEVQFVNMQACWAPIHSNLWT